MFGAVVCLRELQQMILARHVYGGFTIDPWARELLPLLPLHLPLLLLLRLLLQLLLQLLLRLLLRLLLLRLQLLLRLPLHSEQIEVPGSLGRRERELSQLLGSGSGSCSGEITIRFWRFKREPDIVASFR